MARSKSPQLSPSQMHAHLIEAMTPKLTWRGEAVVPWQRRVRRKLRELLGVPSRDGTPLNVRTLWSRQTRLGSIEKLLFTAETGADVPAYWCVPKAARPPYRVFICLQGHNTGMHHSIGVARDEITPMEVPGDRDFAIGCLKQGFAALCIEQRSQGERAERLQEARSTHNGCHDAACRALLLGRTLVGERVFDVDRALDYLQTRGDVDRSRIGIMGNSGGGTVATYAAALQPRLALAIPSCAFGSYAVTSASIYHCGCHYVPHILKWMDMGDVLGALAPRPLVIVAGRNDPISPVLAATRRQFAQVKRIYRELGASDRCRMVIGEGGHRFYADLAWRAMLPMLRGSDGLPD